MEKLLYSHEAIERGRLDQPLGHMLWFCSQTIGTTEGIEMNRMVIGPGESNDWPHHSDCDEVFYLLHGRMRHELGGKAIIQEEGDFLALPCGSVRRSTNVGEDEADLIIAFSAGTKHSSPDAPAPRTAS